MKFPLIGVLKTSTNSVISDYHRLMDISEYKKSINSNYNTIIKLNLSWSLYYPACSTQPWQLEGVLSKLKKDKYSPLKIIAVENQTVVTHPWKGAYGNKWLPILNKFNVNYFPLTDAEWVKYKPITELLAMNDLFKEILVPKMFIDSNIIHLPTLKTHGHTTTTGAMKNAFGGLIPKYRHHAHKKIHEVLVDLLAIQKDIHRGIFAVMDGTVCGNGAGPRTMEPYIGNILLGGADQVAIDAIAAKIMGFEPMKVKYLKIAHDKGLGIADIDQIDIVGMSKKELLKINFGFKATRSPVIFWDQLLRKNTSNIRWLHNLLFHSPIFKTFIFCSEFYHDHFWYPVVGKSKIKKFNETEWGRLFEKYEYGKYPVYKK
ncbi:MAG: DUF362 domain-containing protein, partial [Candidatus Woesearchaeota archaeon]